MAVNQTNFGKVLVVHDAYFAVDALENTGAAAEQWGAAETIRTDNISISSSTPGYSFILGSLAKGKYAFSLTCSDPDGVLDKLILMNNVNLSDATKVIPLVPETFFPLDGANNWRIRVNYIDVADDTTMTFVLKKL